MAVQPTRRRFTTVEYDRLVEAGVLTKRDRVELIDGEILEMSPIGPRHTACVDRLNHIFVKAVGDVAIVRVQGPVHLGDHSEPEPDLLLLRRRGDFYASGHPTEQAVFLAVEVGDSSVEYDRQVKAPLYARSGIPELWLVDIGRELVTVDREPSSDGYATTRVFRRSETISPAAFPHLQIAVADILG